MSDVLTNFYNNVNPFAPLPAGHPAYVHCEAVRGDNNILADLGNEIHLSHWVTCQLYVGHRGGGKSTELLRLKNYLENSECYVVYFAADENDVDPEDTAYTDILLACTRRLLEGLRSADPQPLLNWLRELGREIQDLAGTKLSFEDLSFEVQLNQFAKFSTAIRANPTERAKIRRLVNPHTTTLVAALNQFIEDGKKNLPKGKKHLVLIADNLDRIVPVEDEHGRLNHEEIFLVRNEQLKALNCHVIYTVPISLVYSERANDLKDFYGGTPQILPMVMINTKKGDLHLPGFNKMKEVISRRAELSLGETSLNLETVIFENRQVLEHLCRMSGGHIRDLLVLTKEAINRSGALPITARAVQRAITEARDTYRRTVGREQWEILADVAITKRIQNDQYYRQLLFRRCLLEYRYFDAQGEMQCWYDVHPLIKNIDEFKEQVANKQQL